MRNTLFSVIIPTLNEENYLPKLLTDLSKQVNKSFEVIVVDGKSEDKTKNVAEKFASKLPVCFYSVKKRNLSYQRNYGASKACGKYLIFLDADVRIGPQFLKNLNSEISKSNHLIYLPVMLPDKKDYGDEILFKLSNMLVEFSQNTARPLPIPSAAIFQRDFFNLLGGYCEKNGGGKILFPEDHEIIMRAKDSGVQAKVARNVRFRFSSRRMKTEGKFNVIRKYVMSSIEVTLSGKASTNLAHEMGGQVYKNIKKDREKWNFKEEVARLQEFLKKTSDFLQ